MPLLSSLRRNVFPLFFEETRVARYLVIRESMPGFTLPSPISDLHTEPFDAPGLLLGGPAPVVMFETTPHTDESRFTIRLNNDAHFIDHTFIDNGPQSWHKVLRPGSLRPTENRLTFNVPAGGSVTFSNVVILYTANELTVKTAGPVVAQQ